MYFCLFSHIEKKRARCCLSILTRCRENVCIIQRHMGKPIGIYFYIPGHIQRHPDPVCTAVYSVYLSYVRLCMQCIIIISRYRKPAFIRIILYSIFFFLFNFNTIWRSSQKSRCSYIYVSLYFVFVASVRDSAAVLARDLPQKEVRMCVSVCEPTKKK